MRILKQFSERILKINWPFKGEKFGVDCRSRSPKGRNWRYFCGEFSDENCGSVVVVGGLRNVEFRGECEA